MNLRTTISRSRGRLTEAAGHVAGTIRRRTRHRGPLPFVAHQPTTNPILPVDDMVAAIEFYRRVGFAVTAYDPNYAWVNHCGWEWLHLRKVDDVTGNQASAYLHVANADAWRAAMGKAAAGTVTLGALADMPWGLREFSFTDPSGNVIRVGHHI